MTRAHLSALLFVCIAAGLVCTSTPARAEESAQDAAATTEDPTTAEAARVAAAFAAGDEEALATVTGDTPTDPWSVADTLLHTGQGAAARAYAQATVSRATEHLAGYLEKQRATATQEQARVATHRQAVAQAGEALRGGDTKRVLALTQDLTAEDTPSSVAVGRLWLMRARAATREKDTATALAAYEQLARVATEINWFHMAARAHLSRSEIYFPARRVNQAVAALDAALSAAKQMDTAPMPQRFVRAQVQLYRSRAARYTGNMREAARLLEGLPAELQAVGAPRLEAFAWNDVGITRKYTGDLAGALEAMAESKQRHEALEDPKSAANVDNSIANVQLRLGNLLDARKTFRRLRKLGARLKDLPLQARATTGLARAEFSLANYAKALTLSKEAIERTPPHRRDVPVAFRGRVYESLGRLPEAISDYRHAQRIAEAAGNRTAALGCAMQLASLYERGGDLDRARELQEDAIEAFREAGNTLMLLSSQVTVARIALKQGFAEPARRLASEALATAERAKSYRSTYNALIVRGRATVESDRAAAEADFARALRTARACKDRALEAHALVLQGGAALKVDAPERALERYQQATRLARRLRLSVTLTDALTGEARAQMRLGNHASSLASAQAALREMEQYAGGLGEEEGARIRQAASRLFRVGAAAAAALDRDEELLLFLESGRASALLESLGGREALRWTDLPEALATAQAEARSRLTAAHRACGRAAAGGSVKAARAAAKELDAALDHLREVGNRIQREAKKQAGLFYPRAATLDEVQASLESGDALVLYALSGPALMAYIIRSEDTRWVRLGLSAPIYSALEALQATAIDDTAAPALARLRKLVIAPLALPEDVTRLLISPAGPLSFAPFSALVDLPVAMVPSGTTYVLLRDQDPERGEGVFALGDPDYSGESTESTRVYVRGQQLTRLPATRTEAKAVGSHVLLGADATEPQVHKVLAARERWRSVHFACHGLVDPERPILSALAITPSKEDDGFFTALEILRSNIPADLAVLSACETGLGKVIRGEGILGLTRAFMYAGASRVLCSLWKVDDAATSALMQSFYEHWNPKSGEAKGLPAAEALRAAQAELRKNPKWSHPFYWAGWSLWGLPD